MCIRDRVGLVSRDQLMVPERERVILVDHNERGQAVEGIEEAKIVEIIDHHRLGGIQTSEPIYTHQEPVGCTATIVANMHWHRDVDIPPSIAGLLLSAIISDTVLFKSPTCTEYDKKTAYEISLGLVGSEMCIRDSQKDCIAREAKPYPVSYTHLTLPTILRV